MDGGARQQAYDRGHTIFSPDGRLYQVEYARKAVERGSPSVGVRTEDGVVLAARKRLRSPLLDPGTVEKIHRVDDHVAVATAGHAADARRLLEFAREVGQRHRLRYGEPIGVESLTNEIADRVQEYTQAGGSRPYGTALLVAGVDRDSEAASGEPALFEVDPSGTPYGWRATAIGDGAGEIRGALEDRLVDGDGRGPSDESDYREGGDQQWGVERAISAVRTTAEDDLAATELEVWTIGSGPRAIEPLGTDAVANVLAETA